MNNIKLSNESLQFLLKHSAMNKSRLKPSVSFNLTERNSDYEISDSQNDSDELELPRKKLKTKYAASKSFSAGDGILPKNRKASKFVSSKSEEKISNDQSKTRGPKVTNGRKPTTKALPVTDMDESFVTPPRLGSSLESLSSNFRSNPSPQRLNLRSSALKVVKTPKPKKNATDSVVGDTSRLVNISTNLSKRLATEKTSNTPERIIQLAYETSGNHTLNSTNCDEEEETLNDTTKGRKQRVIKETKVTRGRKASSKTTAVIEAQYRNSVDSVIESVVKWSGKTNNTPDRIIQLACETSVNDALNSTNGEEEEETLNETTKGRKQRKVTGTKVIRGRKASSKTSPIAGVVLLQEAYRNSVDSFIEPFSTAGPSKSSTIIENPRRRPMPDRTPVGDPVNSTSASLQKLSASVFSANSSFRTPPKQRSLMRSLNIISSPSLSSLNVIHEKRMPLSPSSSDGSSPLIPPTTPTTTTSATTIAAVTDSATTTAATTATTPTKPGIKRKSVQDARRARKRKRVLDYSNDEDNLEVSDEGVGEDISDKQPTVGAGVLERFNPYLAPIGDPFRSRQLLLSEKYRVLWLELLPNCSFSMKIYSPTLVTIVAGTITIQCKQPDGKQQKMAMDALNRIADLTVGWIYHVYNPANDIATYQLTETLTS